MSTTPTSPSCSVTPGRLGLLAGALFLLLAGCGDGPVTEDGGRDGGGDMGPCTPGENGCACEAANACDDGLVCRDSLCAPATTCAEVGCLTGQTCTDQGGGVLGCVAGSCEPGYVWTGAACQADSNATCSGASSIEADCEELGRSCVMVGVGATCGDCLDGTQPFGSSCDGSSDCGSLGCATNHRACVSGPVPMCGGCLSGYQDVAGTCTLAACVSCATAHRVCDTSTSVPQCGACLPGYALDGSNECAPVVTCASLGCAALNRVCSMFPTVACAEACVDGFVWDSGTGTCRPPVLCSELSCQGGEMCVEATGTADAFCSLSCAPGTGLDTVDDVCRPCGSGITSASACDNTLGETRRVLTDRGSNGGNCFCEPRSGYYSDSFDRAALCDEDGDGWVKFNALSAISNPEPRVSNNMGCTLRTVNEVILRNDSGGELAVPLAMDLPLYEPAVLDTDTSSLAYGASAFSAAQLNSFTKACGLLDYNQNGVNDASEFAGSTPNVGAGPAANAIFARYMEFVHFVELHEGWFEDGSGIGDGRYVIRERSRSTTLNLVDASNPPTGSQYWRQCGRHVDRLYQPPPTLPQYLATTSLGGDFADRGEGVDWSGAPGMLHHAQFRCVTVSDTYVTMGMSAQTHPTTVVAASGGGNGVEWVDNGVTQRLGSVESCAVTGSYSPAGVDATNPDQPTFQCSAAGGPQNAQVYWAFVEYQHSGAMGTAQAYRRGCRNECDEDGVAACPTYSGPPPGPGFEYWNYRGFLCDHDAPSDFGRIECGCGVNYSGIGTGCAMGCSSGNELAAGVTPAPGDEQVFFTPGISPLNRDDASSPRHWMCLVPTLSAGTAAPSGGTGYPVFRASVPSSPAQTTDGATLTGGGFVLRSRILQEVNTVSSP